MERVHRTWLRRRYGIEGRVRRESDELFEDGGGWRRTKRKDVRERKTIKLRNRGKEDG